MPVMMELTFHVRAGSRQDPQTGAFIAYCPGLDLYSAANDVVSAREAIRSAIKLFLAACWNGEQFWPVMMRQQFRTTDERAVVDEVQNAEFAALQQAGFSTIFDVNVALPLAGANRSELSRPAADEPKEIADQQTRRKGA